MEAEAQLLPTAHSREHLEAMADALEREMGMNPTDAHEIARFVLGAFDGREELLDDEIDPNLRSVFYELEGNRLLSFRREEYRNEEGHVRRAFYWHIRWENVHPDEDQQAATPSETASVYDELPGNAWSRPASAASPS